MSKQRMKLTLSEKQILDFLIFAETWPQLLSDTGLQSGILRADLLHLISHGFVDVYQSDCRTMVTPFYDADHLDEFAFKATKAGLTAITRQAV